MSYYSDDDRALDEQTEYEEPDAWDCEDHTCWTTGCDRNVTHQTQGEQDCDDFEATQPVCEQCRWEQLSEPDQA